MAKQIINVTVSVEVEVPETSPVQSKVFEPIPYKRWSDSKRQCVWLHEMHPCHLWNVFQKETKGLKFEQVYGSPYFVEMLRLLEEKAKDQ